MPRVSASAFVCCPRHRGRHVLEAFGEKGGANGHVPLGRGPVALHGGCAALRGRWEADGITELTASARLCVAGCDVEYMWPDAAASYCVWLLLLLPLPCFTLQIEILWLDHHN
ncbi:hypothetical protein TcCL_ESM09596 [Trypanosoma cruzi]|nr:hypothetical protein TcCL_ESM09596 [Trypanosoma cruzi]